MSTDLHDLVGAFALDALPEDEHAQVEQHLQECEECAEEARSLVDAAGRLGASYAVRPPASMRESVLRRIDAAERERTAGGRATRDPERVPVAAEDAPGRHVGGPARERARVRWSTVAASTLAAAATVTAVVLGTNLSTMTSERDTVLSQSAQVSQIVAAPDAEIVRADDAGATAVVSASQDSAAFLADGLDALGPDQDYQLWMIGDGGIVSAAVFDADADGRTAAIPTTGLGDVDQLGVTVEPAGGSEQPTTTPIRLLDLPTGA